jgi:hypothetical protein
MKTAQEIVNNRNWTNYTALELVECGRSTPDAMANQLIQAYSKEMAEAGGFVPLEKLKEHIAQMKALKGDILNLLSAVY